MAEVKSWLENISDEEIYDMFTKQKWDPHCALIEEYHSEYIDSLKRFTNSDGSQSIFINAHQDKLEIYVIITEYGVLKFTSHYLDPFNNEYCPVTFNHHQDMINKILYKRVNGINEYNPSGYDYSLLFQERIAEINKDNTKNGLTYYEDLYHHMKEYVEKVFNDKIKKYKKEAEEVLQDYEELKAEHSIDD